MGLVLCRRAETETKTQGLTMTFAMQEWAAYLNPGGVIVLGLVIALACWSVYLLTMLRKEPMTRGKRNRP